jgi:hypothetical protein
LDIAGALSQVDGFACASLVQVATGETLDALNEQRAKARALELRPALELTAPWRRESREVVATISGRDTLEISVVRGSEELIAHRPDLG